MGKMFTTADLAGFCAVDRKTVCNWCTAGVLACATTPGGHRRFDPVVVLAFLRTQGFPAPPEVLAAQPIDEHIARRADVALEQRMGGLP